MTTTYELADGIASITMDDGKVNALSPAMQASINESLDRAEADGAVVVLRGRERIFSAGFDLGIMQAGGTDVGPMVIGGFELARRMLAFPRPTITVTGGHAIAMGLFLLLSGDHVIGTAGEHRLQANEVAIGLPMPHSATEVLRNRLTPAAFGRATLLSETFDPAGAVAAGILDVALEPEAREAEVARVAAACAALDPEAHRVTKLRARAKLLAALDEAIDRDRNNE